MSDDPQRWGQATLNMEMTTMTQNTMIKRYEHIIGMMGELSYHLPEVLKSFDDMRLATMLDGRLDRKSKDLIGLGLAIASGGEGWIEHFAINALQHGVDRLEILETIGVALMMGGGAVMKHSCEAYEIVQEYELRDRKFKRDAVESAVEAALHAVEDIEDEEVALAR
jgi:alkylhydroperoxidase/carboxymuconolactone decarboxylase family protein YurZ